MNNQSTIKHLIFNSSIDVLYSSSLISLRAIIFGFLFFVNISANKPHLYGGAL